VYSIWTQSLYKMKFSLVFKNSGDSITFESLNDSIVEFYVDYLNTHDLNEFESVNPQCGNTISQKISTLHENIQEVNKWIEILIDKKFESVSEHDYLNQDILNAYHADWVKSQSHPYDINNKRIKYNNSALVEQVHDSYPDEIRFPPVGDVINKLNYKEIYDKININVHNVERSFDSVKYQVRNQDWVEIKNPFLQQGLSHNIANFKMSFNHLGRTLYNKFTKQDNRLQYHDENTYSELLGFVELQLVPSETVEMSVEYKEWCKIHDRDPLGEHLNLGNIPDLDKRLTDYRIVVYRNLLKDNSFSIQLN
jgi:hypothetical protein